MPGFSSPLSLLICGLLLSATVHAQEQVGHNDWREPSFSISTIGKASVAKAALDVLVDGLDSSSGVVTNPSPGLDIVQSATFIQTLSRYDQLSGNRTYESQALAAFVAFRHNNPTFAPTRVHSDTARWGLAAYYASTVYDGPTRESFLDGATAAWELLQSFQLTPEIASSGHLASKEATFQSTCNGSSVAGAVLWLESGEAFTNSETMGPFIALSSYLYNETHNQTYDDAAKLAIGFMQTFLSDGKTPTHDNLNLAECAIPPSSNFTYNSGYFIEGLAAYTASTGDGSQQEYLNNLIEALVQVPEWYRSDGVLLGDAFSDSEYAQVKGTLPDQQIIDDSQLESDWKSIYLNDLYTCVRLGLLNPNVAEFVNMFIAIQYNAIRQLANSTVNGTIAYSPSWGDQPLQVRTAWGQLAAAEVLTIAMNVTTPRDTTTDTSWVNSPGSSGSTTSSFHPWPTGGMSPGSATVAISSSSPSIGAIVGGVCGAVVMCGLIGGVLHSRRQKRRNLANVELSKYCTEPYTGTMRDYPNPGRAAMIVPATDSSGRLLKLEPMQESISAAVRMASELIANRGSQLPHEGSSPDGLALQSGGQTRHARSGKVLVDIGLMQSLLAGIRETRAALSDLQQQQQQQGYAGPSRISEPPEYGDSTHRRVT